MEICKDKVVTIEYNMTDEQGVLIDSSDNTEPLVFIQGFGSMLPGLEKAVEGHKSGERLSLSLAPDEAFGPHDETLVETLPKERFGFINDIQVGMKFKSPKGDHEKVVTVVDVSDDKITVDTNHPLAGATVKVDLVIVGVRDAIAEELSSGQVLDMEDIYNQEIQHNLGKKIH